MHPTERICIVNQDSLQAWPRPWEPPAVVFTSPRYNKGMDYGRDAEGRRILDDSDPIDYHYQLQAAWKRCAEECAPGAALWVNVKPDDPIKLNSVHCAAMMAGWDLQHTFSWVYHVSVDFGWSEGETIGQFTPTQGPNPHWGFELVLLYRREGTPPIQLNRTAEGVGVPYADKSNLKRFTAGNGGQVKPDSRCRGNVWVIPYETKVKRNHPCPFPIGLPEMALRLMDLPAGSVVADPFCGTGATLAAAARLGLRGLGMDLNPDYCEEARHRTTFERLRRAVCLARAAAYPIG